MSENDRVDQTTSRVLNNLDRKQRLRTAVLYCAALVLGVILGLLHSESLMALLNFIATVFTRLFSFIAVPIIALSILTTIAKIGNNSQSGRIFIHTIFYTLLTTVVAAAMAALLLSLIHI